MSLDFCRSVNAFAFMISGDNKVVNFRLILISGRCKFIDVTFEQILQIFFSGPISNNGPD
jgi:hypothetical protein